MKTNGCKSVRTVGVYSLIFVLALFLAAPTASLAESKAADSAGGQAGAATEEGLTAGTIAIGVAVAAAVVAVAVSGGGDDIVVAPPVPDPDPEPVPTFEEYVEAFVDGADSGTEQAYGELVVAMTDAENAAFNAMIAALDAESLAVWQGIVADDISLDELMLVFDALEVDDLYTRIKQGAGYGSLCAGGATVAQCVSRQKLYESLMDLSSDLLKASDAIFAQLSNRSLEALGKLLPMLDADELEKLQDVIANGTRAEIVEELLAAILEDGGPGSTVTHHGSNHWTVVYHD